jgi:hypothetical protein
MAASRYPSACSLIAADDIGHARHLAVAPNGDVYVAMRGTGAKGSVAALRDTRGSGRFELKERSGYENGTGIGLCNGYLYLATTTSFLHYRMTPGKLTPDREPQTIARS